MSMLKIQGVSKHFDGVTALAGVDIAIEAGEIVGLVGPNGSGKTTLFNCVMGDLTVDQGEIHFEDQNITNWAPHRVARHGMVRSYQEVRVFEGMNTLENLMLAGQHTQGNPILGAFFRTKRVTQLDRQIEEQAREVIAMLGLTHLADEYADNLSYGQQKLLAIGTTLMCKPRMILLDEPMAAVNPTLIRQLMDHIRFMHELGSTVLIVEHNIPVVMELCRRVLVMNNGHIIADGEPGAVRENPDVIKAYFGN